jgi:hypothetical protein
VKPFRSREGPSPHADDDPSIERFPGQLSPQFTPRRRPTQSVPRERITYLAQAIHRLGPRPLGELFLELAAGAPLIPRLEAYARLEPYAGFIAANDGDELPLPKIVAGRRP